MYEYRDNYKCCISICTQSSGLTTYIPNFFVHTYITIIIILYVKGVAKLTQACRHNLCLFCIVNKLMLHRLKARYFIS